MVDPTSSASNSGAPAPAQESGPPSGSAPKKIPNEFDGTLNGLKALDEDLYNMMIQSLAMNMCNELKKNEEEAKKKRKEQERWIYGN